MLELTDDEYSAEIMRIDEEYESRIELLEYQREYSQAYDDDAYLMMTSLYW